MIKKDELLKDIANSLQIARGNEELERSYHFRLIYSAIGRMAYGALFSKCDGNDISVMDFTTHIKSWMQAYDNLFENIFPKWSDYFYGVNIKFFEYVKNLFLVNGYAYHRDYYLRPAVFHKKSYLGVDFLRGFSLNERVFISGLGGYRINKDSRQEDDIVDFYQLDSEISAKIWRQLLKSLHFKTAFDTSNLYFLQDKENFIRWEKAYRDDVDYTIARVQKGKWRSYYICQIKSGKLMLAAVPDYIDNQLIVSCYLKSRNTLPKTIFHVDGNIVNVDIKYPYPNNEQRFLELYSWPDYLVSDNNYQFRTRRVLNTEIFFSIRNVLEKMGINFLER